MFSYLQSKFTIPFFLNKKSRDFLEEGMKKIRGGTHLELQSETLLDLTHEVITWINEIEKPVVWMRLDALDADPGRFWTLLIFGLRRHYPNLGQNLLGSISDHHVSPSEKSLHNFAIELQTKPFVIFFSGCKNLLSGPLRDQLTLLMKNQPSPYIFVFLNDMDQSLFEQTSIIKINTKSQSEGKCSFDVNNFVERNLLSLLDVWWVDWMEKNNMPSHKMAKDLKEMGEITFFNEDVILPSDKIRAQLRDSNSVLDYLEINQKIINLIEYLLKVGEWLEAYRCTLYIKDFEKAGELLEVHGFEWLENGDDPYTLLFWLRELPSVLLTARPIPALLAAKTSQMLGLNSMAKIYLAHVENNLSALERFCQSQEQFLTTIISENGMKVSQLNQIIKNLKLKLG